jgi:release factor glutamine methyltransferase
MGTPVTGAPTTNARAILAAAVRRLAGAGVDDAAGDARALFVAATGIDRLALLVDPDRPVDGDAALRFAAMVDRRAGREPVHRILGAREFWGLPFRLSADTLEPRPDSETIVAAALDAVADRRTAALRVLDLGTGTGCLLLALLSELPAAWGLGTDRAAGAALTARANARALGLDRRASFLVADWTAPLAGRFDLVVSNPPYIPDATIQTLAPEVRDHDPRAALAGGPDGLAPYRIIAADLPRILAAGGSAVFEVGSGQADDVARIGRGAGLDVASVRADHGGVARAVVLRAGDGGTPEKKVGSPPGEG